MANTQDEVQWFRTDEKKEAFESLKFANKLIGEVDADPYYWKWVILAIHNALQATMVVALTGSTQMGVLSEKSKMKVAEREDGVRQLADFMDLYRMVKRESDMKVFIHSKPLQPSGQMNEDVAYIHRLRNNFNHFLPSGWSIRIDELPGVLASCLSATSFLALESNNVFWYENPSGEELRAVLAELQGKLAARSPPLCVRERHVPDTIGRPVVSAGNIETVFASEHRALLDSATGLIQELEKFRNRLRPDAGVAHAQHFDFAERALALRLYLAPALDLAFSGDYLPAFAILRSALEHHLMDRLLFLGDRYKSVFTKVKKADFEQLHADWKNRKPGTERIVKLQFKDGTVVMIQSGLHPSNPTKGASRSTISIYYFLLKEFDPFAGHPKQQPYLSREFWSVGQHTKHAEKQQELYRQNLSWEQIKSNLIYNRLCTAEVVRRFEVHYHFLSAFVHPVPAAFELIYGRNQPTRAPRYDHYASELALLYINKIASEELKALERMTRRVPTVGLEDWPSVVARIKTADAVAAHLWFPGDDPHPFDYVQEANYRGLRRGKVVPWADRSTPAQLKISQIRYYRHPFRRLVQMHSTAQEMTGFPYATPWPRQDAWPPR